MSNQTRKAEAARLLAWRLQWPAEQYAEMAQHFEDVRRFTKHRGTNETKALKWLAQVEAYYGSGLSKAEFCRRNGLAERTLTDHISKLEAKLPECMRELRNKYRL